MLGKLLKYEIRAMGRIMLPLYLVMIFIAGLFAVNMRMSMSGNRLFWLPPPFILSKNAACVK